MSVTSALEIEKDETYFKVQTPDSWQTTYLTNNYTVLIICTICFNINKFSLQSYTLFMGIFDSHGGDYEEHYLIRCDAVYSGRS
jgi:hypothetical protein